MSFRNGQLDERLKKQKLNKNQLPNPDEEAEEEMQRPSFAFLNRQKNAFDSSSINGAGGINTNLSVFDKKAVFSTGGDDR